MVDPKPKSLTRRVEPNQCGTLFRSGWFWFLLAAAILAARHLGELAVPQLRNEDGLVFFQQALVWGGWHMIWWPYAGYIHLLPRLIAALLQPIPFEWVPLAYSLSACVMISATAARISVARIPRLAAVAGALGLVVVPGYGISCLCINLLHFPLTALIAINLLEPGPRTDRETVRRFAELFLSALTGPESIVLAPFALVRGWHLRRSWRGLLMLSGLGLGATVQLLIFLGAHRSSETEWRAAIPSCRILFRYAKLLFGGWFGADDDWRAAAIVFTVAIALIIGVWSVRGQRHRRTVVLLLLGGAAFLSAGRAASTHWADPFSIISGRHIFLPFVAVFWALGWLAAGISGWGRVVPILLAAAIVVSALTKWTAAMPPDLRWHDQVVELNAGRLPVFADTRSCGGRCFTPLKHSALLWVPALGIDGGTHAFAISVPRIGPLTTEEPENYVQSLKLP